MHGERAIGIASRFGLHVYRLTVEPARSKPVAPRLYTQVLQHGQRLDGLTVRDPP